MSFDRVFRTRIILGFSLSNFDHCQECSRRTQILKVADFQLQAKIPRLLFDAAPPRRVRDLPLRAAP